MFRGVWLATPLTNAGCDAVTFCSRTPCRVDTTAQLICIAAARCRVDLRVNECTSVLLRYVFICKARFIPVLCLFVYLSFTVVNCARATQLIIKPFSPLVTARRVCTARLCRGKMSVCLSVCPSVCRTPVFCLNGYTYPQTFLTIE